MWRRVTAFLIVCCLALASAGLADAAAKKKKTKKAPAAPAISKPIYEAPMRVVIVRSSSPSCEPLCPEWIAAEGEITGATPAAFSKVFKQMGKRKLPVIIRSPGGSINAALEIGRMIRKRGLDVSLGWTSYTGCAPDQKSCKLPPEQKGIYRGLVLSSRAFCNSACPLILAGGVTRLAPSDTYVGVHQPKTTWTREIVTFRERYRIVKGKKKVIERKIVGRKPGKSRVTYGHDKALRKKLTAYYKEMGVDPKILDEAEKTKYKDIDYLTPAEVNQFHLRTLPTGPETLAGPKVCGKAAVPGNCAVGVTPQKALPVTTGAAPQEQRPKGRAMSFYIVRSTASGCEPKCPEWIAADGVIEAGTVGRLKLVLAGDGGAMRPIVINSPGGDFDAALEMGRIIRKSKAPVFVFKTAFVGCNPTQTDCVATPPRKASLLPSGECADACVFVLAGGTYRVASRTALKNPTRYLTSNKNQTAPVLLHAYLSEMGISTNLIQRMHGTGMTTVLEVPGSEMRRMKLVNDTLLLNPLDSVKSCSSRFANCVEAD